MNKPLRRVSIFCLILIGALLLRANWVQVVKADSYANNGNNKRLVYEMYAHPRGDFLVDNKPITGSRKTTSGELKYERTYDDGQVYAPVIGYKAPFYGSSYLESIENKFLTGQDDRLTVRNLMDIATGKERRGGDVALTLNGKAQQAAYDGLKGKTGAVVALDPTTGKILAMANTPSYDPSKLAQGSNKQIGTNADALEKDPGKPMDNRTIRYTYAPGSTFKLITAAAALSSGQYKPDTATNFPSPLPYPKSVMNLPDEGDIGPSCHGATLKRALELSCNTVYGGIGDQLGPQAVQKQAEAFGFNNFGKGATTSDINDNLFIPSRVVPSVFPTGIDRAATMQSSIGQNSVAATPLQMAMVVSAIANNGKVMQPYLVDELRAQNQSVIEKTQPKQLSQAVSPEVAQQLQDMMTGVVNDGTGKNAQISGVTVGGKTGTAQHGPENDQSPYAWFVSFADDGSGHKVAVAVVIEDSDAARADVTGGGLAAPIAKSVMQTVLNK